jgi:hypothetical protein
MVHFRERWAVGSWAVEPIFTKRILRTVDFQIEGPKFDLCRDVTRFVKRESVVPPPKTKTRASASREGLMPPRGRRSRTTQGTQSIATTAARSIARRLPRS